MSWRRNGCTATTPRYQSWRRARRSRGTSGPMSGTIVLLAAMRRRRRSITPRATGGMSIPCGIFKASPASCRPTPMAVITRYTIRRASRGRSRPHCAGPMPGGSSSNWPTLPPMHDAARTPRRSRRSHWRRSGGIDVLFDIERGINGLAADERLRIRKQQSALLLAELETWLREQRSRMSRSASVAGPIDYMLKRWDWFARFIGDGRVCLTNNAAERALRGFALGRKSWLFAGSDRGADRAAVMATLIVTAKLNDVNPQAWLADVLARIVTHPAHRLDELLPWNWTPR